VLMELFITVLSTEIKKLHKNNLRLRVIGDTSRFNNRLRKKIAQAEELTAGNTGTVVNIAANYGGKWDILQAAKKLIEEVHDGKLSLSDIDEKTLEFKLATQDAPAPDLFIRTGGEQRISNFLLWQLAYTELYFSDILWPEFSTDELSKAFESYRLRQRRFGRTQEQVVD